MVDAKLEGAGPDPSSFAATIAAFVTYLNGSGCSPNTARAYQHDLSHLLSFLDEQGWDWRALTPARAVDLLLHLRSKPSRRRGTGPYPSLAATDGERSARLSTATINRVLAAVSSFFEWARFTDRFAGPNPITRIHDRAAAHVAERPRPFLTGITSQSALRSPVRLRQIHRLPRPMADEQVDALIAQLRTRRDLAIIRLMLDGGLRPGEVLGLHLADIAYGRRRVTVRVRFDHPRGVRSKSRSERVVDLHESATLQSVSGNVTRGAVTSLKGLGGDGVRMQISAPVQPGNSGGPVVNAAGQIVGVVVSKLDAQLVQDVLGDIPQNINFAIRAEIAKLFLYQNGVEPVEAVDAPALAPEDLAERAEGFTVLISCD